MYLCASKGQIIACNWRGGSARDEAPPSAAVPGGHPRPRPPPPPLSCAHIIETAETSFGPVEPLPRRRTVALSHSYRVAHDLALRHHWGGAATVAEMLGIVLSHTVGYGVMQQLSRCVIRD